MKLAFTILAGDLSPSQEHGPASLSLELASHRLSRGPPRCHCSPLVILTARITMVYRLLSLGMGVPPGSHPVMWLELP